MSEWIEWCIALIQVCVDWLGSIQLLGVSVGSSSLVFLLV